MNRAELKALLQVKRRVDGVLEDFFVSRDSQSELHRELEAFCLRGGKRLRAYLVALGYRFSGGEVDDGIIDVASAFELMHNAALIHDDYIDGDDVRRGEPTVHSKYGKKTATPGAGRTAAIVAGNILIGYGMELMAQADLDPGAKVRAGAALGSVGVLTGIGEAEDVYHSFSLEVSHKTIEQILELKTAKYTLSGPLVLGSILAGGSREDQEVLEKLGDKIGVAFQLKDDALGIYGEKRFGKDVASDLREGKPLLLLRLAWKNMDISEQKQIIRLFKKQRLSKKETQDFRNIVLKSNGVVESEKMAEQYIGEVKERIEDLPISSALRRELIMVANFALERSV